MASNAEFPQNKYPLKKVTPVVFGLVIIFFHDGKQILLWPPWKPAACSNGRCLSSLWTTGYPALPPLNQPEMHSPGHPTSLPLNPSHKHVYKIGSHRNAQRAKRGSLLDTYLYPYQLDGNPPFRSRHPPWEEKNRNHRVKARVPVGSHQCHPGITLSLVRHQSRIVDERRVRQWLTWMATIHSKTPCVCMHAIFIIRNVIKGTIDHLGMPRPLRRVVCLSRIKRKKTEVLMNLSRVFAIQCCFKYVLKNRQFW